VSDKDNKTKIPDELSSLQRKEPLPWEKPKSTTEDPECAQKLEAILNSPSYVPAVKDSDLISSDEARGVRLELEFLKPHSILKEHNIQHTIVVFGSTRIVEPKTAQQNVDKLKQECASKPDNKDLKQKLLVAERILARSHYYNIAREFSNLVTESSNGYTNSQLVVMTGGGPGIMEAANRGAHDANGKTIGLNITLPREQYPNPYVSPELCFQFKYFSLRKMHFMLRARALIAFPGGYGTLDELFETLTLIQTRKITPIPVVLVGKEFWQQIFNIDFMVSEGVIDSEDRDLFWYAETADEIFNGLKQWYIQKGQPLFVTD